MCRAKSTVSVNKLRLDACMGKCKTFVDNLISETNKIVTSPMPACANFLALKIKGRSYIKSQWQESVLIHPDVKDLLDFESW